MGRRNSPVADRQAGIGAGLDGASVRQMQNGRANPTAVFIRADAPPAHACSPVHLSKVRLVPWEVIRNGIQVGLEYPHA